MSLLSVIVLTPTRSPAQQNVQFEPSPVLSMSGTRQFLESMELRVLGAMGYVYREDLEVSAFVSGQSGVELAKVYVRSDSGQEKRVEVAVVKGLSGGYDLAFAPGDNGRSAGDLSLIVRQVHDLAAQIMEAPKKADPVMEIVRLGHIEASQALRLLAALGYETMSLEQESRSSGSGDRDSRSGGGRGESDSGSSREIADAAKMAQKLPLVIHIGNATKTSLMAAEATGGSDRNRGGGGGGSSSRGGERGGSGSPELGGTHLHSTTAGAPEERLVIVYDRNDPESLERLMSLLQTQIDVAAQQMVIEALVIELNTRLLRDLGVEFSGSKDKVQGSFERSDTGLDLPFTFLFSKDGLGDLVSFKGKLEALAETGEAEVLSSPSVLVLNDRQARIQVGQQVPVVRSTTTPNNVTTSSVEYFPVGIVLNIRPRISPDASEVTMQIETIISSISETSQGGPSQVAFAPVVDNRTVESFVRVADGTPFIIGGLLSTEERERRVGIPILASIPILGRLFSRESVDRSRREVIVVITPHIVPLNDRSFSYLIPKDSDLFDRFDTQLFRNAYRVRDDDVWDLGFIRESSARAKLVNRVQDAVASDVTLRRREPFRSVLEGRIGGEEVLVRRMIYEIVDRLDFPTDVDVAKIFYFAPPGPTDHGQRFVDKELNTILAGALRSESRTALMSFGQTVDDNDRTFTLPLAHVRDTSVAVGERDGLLWDTNRYSDEGDPIVHTIALGDATDLRRLQQVLILKQVLKLNKNVPLTLDAFRPGTQLLFPSREDMRNRFHLIDREVAQMFYETKFYYQSTERMFDRMVRQVETKLREGSDR